MSTHQEMIKSKFISKFKNPLRNYYSYGFMSYSEIEESKHTIDDDWRRLSNILKSDSYFTWSDNRNKAMFITSDSASQNCNPFHRVYRFRLFDDGDVVRFYNIVLALSDKYKLAEEPFTVEGDTKRTMRKISEEEYDEFSSDVKEIGNKEISFELSEIDRYLKNIDNNQLETKQLAEFCNAENAFLSEDQNVRNAVRSLEKLGIISKAGSKKNAPWKLNSLTMKNIIECCGSERDSFVKVLNFYSQYFALGEFGNFMLSRINSRSENIFRFRHEYYIHVLNDFVRIDLISAIEQKKWCKIKFSNNMLGSQGEIICFPLQIMTSQKGGREYLSFYEPFQRLYINFRLDFIDSIDYVSDIKWNSEEISLKNPKIAKDIEYARENLSHSWGVSTTVEIENNSACPAPLYEVMLKAKYNPEKEPYILKRFQNERRIAEEPTAENGIITFKIKVTDAREMKPWIRSLYTRIIDYSGLNEDGYNMLDDVEYMLDSSYSINSQAKITRPNRKFEIPKDLKYKKTKADTSDSLFSICFCTYFMLYGDILSKIHSINKDTVQLSEIRKYVSEAVENRKHELGELTEEILNLNDFNPVSILERCGFIEKADSKAYYLKYIKTDSDTDNLFYDTIPLTVWEIRWLKTILQDEKMRMFISDEMINNILGILPEDTAPIEMNKLVYFDRYHPEKNTLNKELYDMYIRALESKTKLYIEHTDGAYTAYYGEYIPKYIEYSKRDDKFRLIVYNAGTGEQFRILCENILKISLTDNDYISDSKFSEMKEYSVTLDFTNEKNIPDRILSEFSPWKKMCVYNHETEKYSLTINYHKYDEAGLIVRIMGYGGSIEISDKECGIYQKIHKRLLEQKRLLSDRE